jgi:putative FmdB family regulatory protein
MPLYEYVCRKCHNKFDEVLTIKEHETKKVVPEMPEHRLGKSHRVVLREDGE